MSGMRRIALAAPAMVVEIVEDAQVFDDAVAQRNVELQDVLFLSKPCVAEQIASVVAREQVFTGAKRSRASRGDVTMQLEVQRMDRFLDPGQRIGLERIKILDGLVAVETAVAVDREAHTSLQQAEHGVDAFDIGSQARAADLNFEAPMALADGAAHIIAEAGDVVRRAVMAAAGINRDLGIGAGFAVTPRQHAP